MQDSLFSTVASNEIEPFLQLLDLREMAVFAKRLSSNDTGATGAHQAGIYLPNDIAFSLCPRLKQGGSNPDSVFESDVMSHGERRQNRLTWYNQGSRDECRITRWADERKRNSVLQRDMTGALVVLLFRIEADEIVQAWVWFCADQDEEAILEDRLGEIEPGEIAFRWQGCMNRSSARKGGRDQCRRLLAEMPERWFEKFPRGDEIVELTRKIFSGRSVPSDDRLFSRRECEYRIFRAIEDAHLLPKIKAGFDSVDAFIEVANSVTNRRKSRSGGSLELQLELVFSEDGVSYTRGGRTEGNKKPDFLFPSVCAYHDKGYPRHKLRMLGVKTTCKDRWRQILNEADAIPRKHLITLQEGLSVNQFNEMDSAGVTLVVPTKALRKKYPDEIRDRILSLEKFIAEAKSAQG